MHDASETAPGPEGDGIWPSALDQAFLELEQPGAPPLHIGFAVEIEGAAPSTAAMRAMIGSAVGATPELTRRLVRDPLTGSLRWIDDPWFDAGAHIDSFGVASLADRAATDALITRLFAPQLPRDRPLWRFQAVTDGSATLMAGQLHHAVADGVGTVELALRLVRGILDGDGGAAERLREPGVLDGVINDIAGLWRSTSDLGILKELTGSARPLIERLGSPSSADWDGDRVIVRGRVPLGPLRDGARARGGTVTAALIVAIARALRGTGIIDRDGSHAFVPLNARRLGKGSGGNPVSVIYTNLPGTGDPVRALREVTQELKEQRHSAGAISDLAKRADDLPSAFRGTVTRAITGQFLAPVIVSSTPGPDEAVELFGRRITGAWGWAPSPPGQPIALSAVSYAGQLHLTLVADVDAAVDGAGTLRLVERELANFSD